MQRTFYNDSLSTSRSKHRSSSYRPKRYSDESRLSESTHRRHRTPSSDRRASRYSKRRSSRPEDLDQSHSIYKVLCIRPLHPKASDNHIIRELCQEFKRFGEFTIKISTDLDERVAYLSFNSSKSARDAHRNKHEIILFDKKALTRPVYKNCSYKSSRSRSRSLSSGYNSYYSESLNRSEFYQPHQTKRSPYDTFSGLLPPQDFRRIGFLPLHPHKRLLPRETTLLHSAPFSSHLRPFQPYYSPLPHLMSSFRPYSQPKLEPSTKNDNDKFPNHLHHIPPEDDPLATRTLFVGNLELMISDDQLHLVFCRYGFVEDIDVKRSASGKGNAYAFVRYQNVDMAHKAKVELSGQYLGSLECKIGYGKPIPSSKIYVAGFSPRTTPVQLAQEFDLYGAIKEFEFFKGNLCAHILFITTDGAIAAVERTRGVAFGGPEYRLRVDFIYNGVNSSSSSSSFCEDIASNAEELREFNCQDKTYQCSSSGENPTEITCKNQPENEGSSEFSSIKSDCLPWPHSFSDIDSHQSFTPSPVNYDVDYEKEEAIQSAEPLDFNGTLSKLELKCDSVDFEENEAVQPARSLDFVCSLTDLARKCVIVRKGSLVLKECKFPVKFHLTFGDSNVLNSVMKNNGLLPITQRLKLEEFKLKTVPEHLDMTETYSVFLIMPCAYSALDCHDTFYEIRTLHTLVSYFTKIRSVGVIPIKVSERFGIMYVFPPSEYSAYLLKKTSTNLSSESLKEDHLVILVIMKDN